MKTVAALFDNVIDSLAYISGILVAFTMLLVVAEVLSRQLLGTSILWSVEVTSHCIYFLTFLSAAWIQRNRQHVRIDILFEKMSVRQRLLWDIFSSVVGVVLCLFIAYRAALTTVDLWQRNINTVTEMELPMSPLIAVMCIGMLLLSIQFARDCHAQCKDLTTKHKSKPVGTN